MRYVLRNRSVKNVEAELIKCSLYLWTCFPCYISTRIPNETVSGKGWFLSCSPFYDFTQEEKLFLVFLHSKVISKVVTSKVECAQKTATEDSADLTFSSAKSLKVSEGKNLRDFHIKTSNSVPEDAPKKIKELLSKATAVLQCKNPLLSHLTATGSLHWNGEIWSLTNYEQCMNCNLFFFQWCFCKWAQNSVNILLSLLTVNVCPVTANRKNA